MEASEAIGSSGDHSTFIVEALDGSVVDLAFGLEPVEKVGFILAKGARNPLHRLDPGTKGCPGPIIEEVHHAGGTAVAPDLSEAFLEEAGPDRCQIAFQKLSKRFAAFTTDALPTAEKKQAGIGQKRVDSLTAHLGCGVSQESLKLGADGSWLVNGFWS